MDKRIPYGNGVRLDLPYDDVVNLVKEELREEGFGIQCEIDVRATMKEKLDADFRKYIILGACNPSLAYQALSRELTLGLLLPCNVVVYEEEGGSMVWVIDPLVALSMVGNESLREVARQADEHLTRVLHRLEKKGVLA